MDIPEEDGSRNKDIDSLKEFGDGSDYIEPIEENSKDNVNTTALEWPLRHNNDSENLTYTFNGFRQIKKPRCTYTGRISRVPSRYRDSDSDSSDGSTARQDIVSRLKVKRRRKPSSTNKKSLINGYKEHSKNLSLKHCDAESIICNISEKEREEITNLDCSEVFEEESTSEDTISRLAHETQARFFPVNNMPSEAVKERECFAKLNGNDIWDSNHDSVSEFSVENASSMCCLEGGCVDISTQNKGLPRFDSRMISPDSYLTYNSCDKEASIECKRAETIDDVSTTEVLQTMCKRAKIESCDSSTMDVSSIKISKQRKMSCASLVSNDSDVSTRKGNDNTVYSENAEKSCANDCWTSQNDFVIEPGCQTDKRLDFLVKEDAVDTRLDLLVNKDAVLSEACLEKCEILPVKPQKEQAKEQKKDEDCSFKPKGLNCFKNFTMKRNYYTKKLNQKLRRTDRVKGNSDLKKNGVIGRLKRKSVDKVKKAVKLQKKKIKANNKKVVQNVNRVKTSFTRQELDRVLGMRRNPAGVYQFLVQWKNGTSCWVSSDQIVSNKHNCILREYFMESNQDVSVINRIPFQAYCCDSLSLKECKPKVNTKKAKEKFIGKSCPPIRRTSTVKKEVIVENDGNHCYITVTRESCKRKLTCVKIITELITALEDASVSDCLMVIIKGLGGKVFGGLNLEVVCKASAEEKGNMMLSKMRYLVQTLSNYPKPLVALISKPAEGIGAVFVSLFDLIWEEDAWGKMQADDCLVDLSRDTSLHCLPRVLGHSVPSEEILMGKECESLQDSHACSVSLFASTICNENGHESTVMSTLKEVKRTLQHLGKRTSLLDINGKDIFKMAMDQSSDSAVESGSIADGNSFVKSEIEGDLLTPDTDSNFCPSTSTSSAPADNCVKELESQILYEKQLAHKYFKEILSIYKEHPSSISSSEKC